MLGFKSGPWNTDILAVDVDLHVRLQPRDLSCLHISDRISATCILPAEAVCDRLFTACTRLLAARVVGLVLFNVSALS